jgi:hypothetical protein
LLGRTDLVQRQMARRDAEEAEHQAKREQDHLRSLGQPRVAQPALPQLKVPELAQDFDEQVAQLDQKIFDRGVAIDSDKLLRLGKERFAKLLDVARHSGLYSSRGAALDLSAFQSTQRALGVFEAPTVARRKTHEVVAQSGRSKGEVRRIAGWSDLWKATQERDEVLRDVYSFRDLFESLVLGQSMLEKCSSDGKLRSRFFAGGKARKVDLLLTDWRSAIAGEHVIVKLVEPLWSVLSWLANEKAPPAAPGELARDWFNVRAPSKEQLQTVSAVVDGWLLDYDGWHLWQYVGRQTRSAQDQGRLATWRTQLAKRFVRIAGFHTELCSSFVREIDMGDAAPRQQQFELAAYRRFVDRSIDQLLQRAGELVALGLDEVVSGAVVARFQDRVLLAGKHNQIEAKRVSISRQLATAFEGAQFELEFAELRS